MLGICNGFQMLCEAHLLPGALIRNDHRHFICRDQKLRVENSAHRLDRRTTRPGQEIVVPLKNSEGRYVADRARAGRAGGRGPRRRSATSTCNPNGSLRDIAGITNDRGQRRRPDAAPRARRRAADRTRRTDGLGFFTSVLKKLVNA